jgi:hypothetical protein
MVKEPLQQVWVTPQAQEAAAGLPPQVPDRLRDRVAQLGFDGAISSSGFSSGA